MGDNNGSSSNGSPSFYQLINGDKGAAQSAQGITTKAFALNLATGLALFLFELTGFFLLKSANIGRRIYQPKTYLVQERLRVEAVPANPFKWLYRIFTITSQDLKLKCGLDGYFFIRFIRAMLIVFLPLMAVIVTVLLPVNYHGGKNKRDFLIGDQRRQYNVTGLDTLSWQNVAPTQTNRYWAHLVCALLAVSWTLYRIYREKLHFIDVRQQYLLAPEHRLKASARTVLVTNIPSEYRSKGALEAFYDVFVDNDDRSKLHVWLNRDYGPLKALVMYQRNLRHSLEKEELKILRLVNKQQPRRGNGDVEADDKRSQPVSQDSASSEPDGAPEGETEAEIKQEEKHISTAFEADCRENETLSQKYLKASKQSMVNISRNDAGNWQPVSTLKFWKRDRKQETVRKTAYLRAEIARVTLRIEKMMQNLDSDAHFKRQNSAFIQFDRQMAAHMACSLVSHHQPGLMNPRFLDVAPHEIIWPNMGLTSLGRFVRTVAALLLFVGMLLLWGVPTTFLGFLSQLDSLRASTQWLAWLRPWPSYVISLIAGPLTAILLALLVQLVVPALCRKLAVLVGAPTRSTREVITQAFYFTFLFIELVLVTSISSGIIATVPAIIANPTTIAATLATNLPKAANYFFNYLIIQGLAFSGSVLFQYLRLLYITMIWPWFTQTPREEAWLQTTIPHQMWANMYGLITNFAVIGLIYSVIAPLMLVFISASFAILWVAYRHNYYYVQRVKVDTHGMLFEKALSQLVAGVYVLEIALIGLFFLVRNSEDNVACTPQAIIMIVALVLTGIFHWVLEANLRPLYEFLPVSLEDDAADKERERFRGITDMPSSTGEDSAVREGKSIELSHPMSSSEQHRAGDSAELSNPSSSGSEQLVHTNGKDAISDRGIKQRPSDMQTHETTGTDAATRKAFLGLRKQIAARLANNESQTHSILPRTDISRRIEVGNQLGAAIADYPDELTDLSLQELEAELKVAYQDPITREPAPIIWIPQDAAGVSEDMIKQASKYGRLVQYSNAGAYLSKANKCEITRPAPDVRPDWLLDWVL